jgi:hypothetical protein
MDSKNLHVEDDIPFTEEELRATPAPSRFPAPPNYPMSTGQSYELGNMPPHPIGGAEYGAPPPLPPTARGEPFNFGYYAPKRNPRRYFVATIILLALALLGSTISAGVLSHKLSTQAKVQPATSITTLTQVSTKIGTMTITSFTTLTPSPSAQTGSTPDSTTTITVTPSPEQSATPRPAPTGTPVVQLGPQATCAAHDDIKQGFDISLWTNFLLDDMSQVLKLSTTLDRVCETDIASDGWTTNDSQIVFTLKNGTTWQATQQFDFWIPNIAGGPWCVMSAVTQAFGSSFLSDTCIYNPGGGEGSGDAG